MTEHNVPIQSLIDHIKTAIDVDEWAKDMVEELLTEREPKPIKFKENWMTGLPIAICPKCGRFAQQFHMAHPSQETHFCPWCGQEVKWNEYNDL